MIPEILLHDETQLLDWGESRSVGPWLKIRLRDPEQLDVFRGMDTATAKKTGHILNVTITQGDILPAEEPDQPEPAYSKEAQALWQSGFFYNPKVWKALGTDVEYLEWVKNQPSCLSGEYSEYHDDGNNYSIACHVRRAGEAGTAYKPEYSAVPMRQDEHDHQHQHGEAECLFHFLGRSLTDKEAKDWFDKKRMEYVSKWASLRLKETLGYEHLSEIPPVKICSWAVEHNLVIYLPKVFKGG